MKCEYINTCPSATGWCMNKKPSIECVASLQQAIENMRARSIPIYLAAFCEGCNMFELVTTQTNYYPAGLTRYEGSCEHREICEYLYKRLQEERC